MIISFVGAPASGKTTTAAMLFAYLKDQGEVVEFVAEQARMYIAEKRISKPKSVFTDLDQFKIMKKQFNSEKIMNQAAGEDGIIITDSSALNALLYMSPDFRNKPSIKKLVKTITSTNHYELVFYSQQVRTQEEIQDPNRIHSTRQSNQIHKSIPAIFQEFAPNIELVELSGNSTTRLEKVLETLDNYR